MDKKTVGVAVIALIVGFGAGYYTHPSSAQVLGQRGFGGAGGGAYGGMRGGGPGGVNGGFLSGTVAAKDATSITINTRDGSSHVVLITPATSVSKSVTGALTDAAVGSTIIVSGTNNSDGSVSASLIQLRPAAPTAQ